MSNSFSWMTCTTSKLEENRGNDGQMETGRLLRKERVPFIRRDRIDQNVTVDVYGVRLREDGVLILQRQRGAGHRSHWPLDEAELTAHNNNNNPHFHGDEELLTRTCPAVSTSCRWYSCPFIVIIFVKAAGRRHSLFALV